MCLLENTHEGEVVRILLVEHHTAVREAIAFAFERSAGFEVVAQAASLSEARAMLEGIDVAVVDLGLFEGYGGDLMPGGAGVPEVVEADRGETRMLKERLEVAVDLVLIV